jgi:RNA polymerase sigma factor (sigma-70 family)
MAHGHADSILRHLHCVKGVEGLQRCADRQLLHSFTCSKDEVAFTTLVKRHGPLVWSVCRRVLANGHDAEDAFQATFLVLARRAGTIHQREAVGSWLYGVAYRTAMSLKRAALRRKRGESRAPARVPAEPSSEASLRELQGLLDAEVARLPQKYRTPFVLCCLDGKGRAEIAGELGVNEGTLSTRIAEARKRLQARLGLRGVTLSAALCALTISQTADAAPAGLLLRTARAALLSLVGKSCGLSGQVLTLAGATINSFSLSALKFVSIVLLALGLTVAGAGAVAYRLWAERPSQAQTAPEPPKTMTGPRKEEMAQRPNRADRHGDPLPPLAVARIGTTRSWHGRDHENALVYSPDGKMLASCDSGKAVRLWDTATGKEVRRFEPQEDEVRFFAVAPDWKTMVTACYNRPLFRVWDLASGKEIRQVPFHKDGPCAIALSPDGKLFAAATNDSLIRLYDVARWQETGRLRGHAAQIRSVVFSADSTQLISAGSAGGDESIRWWNVTTCAETRRVTKGVNRVHHLYLSPDGTRLAGVSHFLTQTREEVVLHLWNAATGEEVSRAELKTPGGIWCLGFSPDSRTLACGDGLDRPGSQIRFFETATGKDLRRWDEDKHVSLLAFSPNGKVLAVAADEVIRFQDCVSGKAILHLRDVPSSILSVGFVDGASRLFTGAQNGSIAFWDPSTGAQCSAFQPPPKQFAGRPEMLLAPALTVDGKKAALVDRNGVLHVWAPATGQAICCIGEPPVGHDQASFSRDGKLVAVKHKDDIIRIWDAATGQLQCTLAKFGGRFPHPHAFSADGRVLATAPGSMDEPAIRLWDASTGKQIGRLAWTDPSSPSCLLFSHDGRYLVTANGDYGKFGGTSAEHKGLRVWDLPSARELRRFELSGDIRSLALSPDGKTVAAPGDDSIVLWEMATGEERGRFTGHRAWVWSVAFSPDGRLLASGSRDYTALVWDVTGLCPDGKLRPRQVDREAMMGLWAELAGKDGLRAYRAIWTMVAAAPESISLLSERLHPVAKVDETKLTRLIGDLDNEKFKVREQATRELEELGDLAEPTIRRALGGKPSLEAQRRLLSLAERVESQTVSDTKLRALRAIEVLEHIGSREARELLQRLANGAPEARLTCEAKKSLERLAKRPASER